MNVPNIVLQSEKGTELDYLDGDGNFSAVRSLVGNWVDSVNMSAHNFSEGDVLRRTTTGWVKASTDTITNASASGVVVGVVDLDNFVIMFSGVWTNPSHGFTVGSVLYLSEETPGTITTDTPVTFYKPIGHVLSTTAIYVNVASTPAYTLTPPVLGNSIATFTSIFAFNGTATAAGGNATILWEEGNTHTVYKHETGSYNVTMDDEMDDARYLITLMKGTDGEGGWSKQGTPSTTSFGFILEKDDGANYDSNEIVVAIIGKRTS